MIGEIFNIILLRPILNLLLLLYDGLGNNFALAIMALTVILRLVTQPLMGSSLKQSKKMAELQPQLKELEKKYAKDKQKLQQEQMRLYKEHGINPLGGCLPMLLQFPIWIALYQAIMQALGTTPLQMLALSKHIYSWGPFAGLSQLVPLASKFLWLDLGKPDPTHIVLPALVVLTQWIQQKMMSPATKPEDANSPQAQMGQSMQMMMPLMFGFFTMYYASGLALYFIISSLVGIVIQYFTTGWGGLANYFPKRATQAVAAAQPAASEQKGTKSGSRKKKR